MHQYVVKCFTVEILGVISGWRAFGSGHAFVVVHVFAFVVRSSLGFHYVDIVL